MSGQIAAGRTLLSRRSQSNVERRPRSLPGGPHGPPISICSFDPATVDALCLADDRQYVVGVLEGRIRIGFGGRELDVAASLLYTTGAMMAAAEEAVLNGGMACAPVIGFHHAHYDASPGFCTFNGLVVTARHLQIQGYALRNGILDLDQHCGDGISDSS